MHTLETTLEPRISNVDRIQPPVDYKADSSAAAQPVPDIA